MKTREKNKQKYLFKVPSLISRNLPKNYNEKNNLNTCGKTINLVSN